MINQLEDPLEILAWLSERNKHIPVEELAFMLETHAFNPDSEAEEHSPKGDAKEITTQS
ncbi:MAG: hypothetical protein R8M46_06300 [Ghiorsea sp.]